MQDWTELSYTDKGQRSRDLARGSVKPTLAFSLLGFDVTSFTHLDLGTSCRSSLTLSSVGVSSGRQADIFGSLQTRWTVFKSGLSLLGSLDTPVNAELPHSPCFTTGVGLSSWSLGVWVPPNLMLGNNVKLLHPQKYVCNLSLLSTNGNPAREYLNSFLYVNK